MALNFVPSSWSQIKYGPERDPAEDEGAMSPHERRFGHEFLGPLLPFGVKVHFRPPDPMLKAQHEFAHKPGEGVFLGWHTHPGGVWSGDLWVGDLKEGKENVRVY